jgi:hypothetical protein
MLCGGFNNVALFRDLTDFGRFELGVSVFSCSVEDSSKSTMADQQPEPSTITPPVGVPQSYPFVGNNFNLLFSYSKL